LNWIARLNNPWLHFIVLGAVLFQLQSVLFPEPRTVIGPLSEARISALQEQWHKSTGRQPSPEQKARYIAVELDRDMLLQRALELGLYLQDTIVYQRLIRNMKFLQLGEGKSDAELFEQALQMRMHLDDEIVKRRLIQVVEQQLLTDNPPARPSSAEVAAAFANRKEELRRPPLYTIEHVFFSDERASEIDSVIATITKQKLNVEDARKLGSHFLQGYRFSRQSPDQLARNFGQHFVLGLEQAHVKTQFKTQQWLGPIPSAYGLHYVWISEFEAARDAQLDEVKQQIRNELEYTAQSQALRCAIEILRAEYILDGQEVQGSLDKALDIESKEVCL
jgi:hypothetical protein